MIRGSGKPKRQFSRPSINVSTEIQDVKKAWQDVDPRLVEVGDIILGQGLVVGIGDVIRVTDPVQYFFHFEMKNGTTYRVAATPDTVGMVSRNELRMLTTVRAFTRVRG